MTRLPKVKKATAHSSYNIDQLSTTRVGFNLLLHWVFEMAAPVPPRGGGAGGGAIPPPLPPPFVLGPVGPPGPVGPAGPLGPPPTRAALLAQMVAAMQAAATGIPAPGPGGPTPPPPRVKLPPPIFKGLPGERPEAHLLRANDWMDTYNILPVNKPTNFKYTLDHLAREWYDSLTFPIAWNDLQQQFSRYFSTQGRSIKHLHDKWRNFSFTPGQDDIEAYIRDVKEAAHQLNYNDEAILHLIKATMPSEIYGTLYNQHDLNKVITMVKDIYAKKPEVAWIWMGSQKKSHTSRISLTQEDEDEVVPSDKKEVVLEATEVRVGQDLRADSEAEEVDSPVEEDSREESLTRVLPPRDPEYLVKLKIKIKIDAITVIKEVTLQRSAQRKTRVKP